MSKTATSTTYVPQGATQLREVHDHWVLTCAAQTVDGVEGWHGVVVQEQEHTQGQVRQRVLAIELQVVEKQVKGTLVLPFGLALQKGVALSVDEGIATTLPFRTNLPIGSVVDLEFDPSHVSELRSGQTLKVIVVTDEANRVVTFTIPLAGLATALDRLQGLVQA